MQAQLPMKLPQKSESASKDKFACASGNIYSGIVIAHEFAIF